MTMTDPSLDLFMRAILERKAQNVVVLDVHALTSVADYFILCSGRSNRQVSAIAEFVQAELRKVKIRPLHVEGLREGHWVLLDYGHIVLHVFYDPVRSFYDLEGLWSDAPRVRTANMEGDGAESAAPEEAENDP